MSRDAGWDAFFEPRLVCVVGASADPSRIGGRLVRYSTEAGYTGRVVPVNPHHRSVFGLPAVPSLSKVDTPPDWVVVAVSAGQVPEVVEQAGEIGARNVAVVASGFAEVGPAGAELQRQLRATARRYGMRLLGPNSNGFMNPHTGAFFAFTPVIDSARPAAGELAIVTQSAALGTYLLNCCHRAGLGVRHWVHTGNEADTTLLEVAAALARRGEVRAIALCVEVLRDLPALHGTLHALAGAGIPVGVLPAGSSPAGRRASQAHTAALIGDEAGLLADLFAHGGAQVCGSIGALADFLQVAVNYPDLPEQPRTGLVTTSGGVGVLAADAFAADRLPMPVLSGPVQERIRSYAPFVHPANPVDTTAQVINEPDTFPRILLDCLDSGELDLVTVFVAHGLAGMRDRTLRQLVEVAERRGGNAGRTGPRLAAVGILSPEAARELQRRGVAALSEPATLSRAVRGRLDSAARQTALLAAPEPPATSEPPASPEPPDGRLLDEWSAKQLLRQLGATVVPGRLVSSSDDAVAAAGELGYPVVLKLSSAWLPHKAAAGGLRLHLWTPEAVRTAYQDLAARGRDLPGEPARLLLERQESGPELFVGCVRHPRLGRLVGIGPGGSGVEQTRAVRWHWAPVRAADVIAASPAAGDRHATAVARLTGSMLRLLDRAGPGGPAGPGIHTVEVNPVILTAGGGAVVADALVALTGSEQA
jgi:acyl-CoA synthetase (NDP forming)